MGPAVIALDAACYTAGPMAVSRLDTMDIDLTLASWSLGRLHGEQLPEVAVNFLEAGFDSASLRELAAEQRPTMRDAGPIFVRSLGELGLVPPTVDLAARRLGRFYAQEIVSGRIEPFVGGHEIWELSLLVNLDEFSPFKWPNNENDILESARHILALPAI